MHYHICRVSSLLSAAFDRYIRQKWTHTSQIPPEIENYAAPSIEG
ncbi:uncharacterized protein ARMOST_02722 [Armillaria ostoyae]|uniref:Uncharacterized protein n=1 Tax=Armillaria ostoyae TaxID=47428 RepID=A0A284QSR0_ARMOS|nr:uncharacterized protein ARMOST_02722 [Armillaria ostoyae]